MHLNLYENHFSFIKKFESYAKKFTCKLCDRVFDRADNLKRHSKECCTEQEEIYVGGKFHRDQTIFERLEEEGFQIPEEDRYYPFVSVFDYEALQVPKHDTIRGRNICFEHVPATFSLCSNIPGHEEAVHVQSGGDPQALVDEMVRLQLEHQKTAGAFMEEKHQVVLEALYSRIEELNGELEGEHDDEETSSQYQAEKKKYSTLYNSLMKYCNQMIILWK